MKKKLFLLTLPLIIIVCTVPARYYSFDLDLIITPIIFLSVNCILHYLRYLSPGFIFIYSISGFLCLYSIFWLSNGNSSVFFLVNSSFYLLALLTSYVFSITGSMSKKIFLIGSFLFLQIYYLLYLDKYMMNFANTGNFTGVADTEISDKLCFKNSGNDTICFADNKTYLLDFWFTGCSACFKAFPQLEEIYNKYKSDTNIKIYSVNIPVKDDTENIAFEIIKERNYSFPVLIGINNIDSVLGIESYPRVFIIKNNKIRFKGLIELAEQNLSQE